MKNRASLLIAVAAGTTFAVADGPLPYYGIKAPDLVREISTSARITPGGYSSRAILTVYDNNNTYRNPRDDFHLGNAVRIAEDFDFGPSGPYSTNPSGKVLRQLDFGFGSVGAAPISVDYVFEVYDEDDVSFTGFGVDGASMVAAGAVPLGAFFARYTNLTNGYYYGSGLLGIPNNGGNGIPIPDDDTGFAVVCWVSNQTDDEITNPRVQEPAAGGAAFHFGNSSQQDLVLGPPASGNPATSGSTLPNYGRDVNNSSTLEGAIDYAVGGAVEHRVVSMVKTSGWDIRWLGDVEVALPACEPIDAVNGSDTASLAAGEVKFYCVDGGADDVQDALNTFARYRTSGGTDTAIALYDSNGLVVGSDDNDGDGNNAELTFGRGLFAAVGDGRQANGRDGQYLAGTYYLAVTTAPATFADNFSVNSTGPGGSVTTHVSSNIDGSALPAFVTPDLGDNRDLGILVDPGVAAPAFDPLISNNDRTEFLGFTVCADVVEGSGLFVDISTDRSDLLTDSELFLFGADGVLIAANDDAGGGTFKSLLSFGDTSLSPRPYGPANASGQNGPLPIGEYFLCQVHWDGTASATGFHVRGTSDDGVDIQTDIYTNVIPAVPCDGACGCPADYNGDGGVDGGDVEAFFTDWEASEGCSDTNQDGGVDGGDVEAFFNAWEAGDPNCGG
ncbi:MAG: hypothetical protein JNK25_05125 [Phycisphaerae bacterium]|nr:hypothetical protein [Phycisphaerae bacterium]